MKKKLLLLSYRSPFPLVSGGKIRIFQTIEILSKFYTVDLVYVDEIKKEYQELNQYCNNVVRFSIGKMERIFNSIYHYLFSSMPLQGGYFYSGKMQKWIDRNIENYDTIYCIHIRTAAYVMKYSEIYRIIDGVDAVSLNYYNKLKLESTCKRILYKLEYNRLCKYEEIVYSNFSKAILISDYDKSFLLNMKIKKNIKVIPEYARDIGYNPSIHIKDLAIAFMGLMRYEPNVNAVIYFINEIYPAVKEKYPLLRFRIIGGEPTKKIRDLNNRDGVEVLGFVNDPALILQEAALIIAPMISGSGLQNKIIESMFLGKAVLTTKQGTFGLTKLTGNEIIVAEDTEEFIEKLIYYLDSKNRKELVEIGANARNYICNNYGYESVESALIKYISDKEKDLQ